MHDFKAPSERLGERGLSPSGQGALGETSAQGRSGLGLVQTPSSHPPAPPQMVSPSLQPRVGRTQWDHPGPGLGHSLSVNPWLLASLGT